MEINPAYNFFSQGFQDNFNTKKRAFFSIRIFSFMDEKELRKLNRQELLEILLEVTEENENLLEENKMLRKKLQSKYMVIDNAGSLAEASLQISGVFKRAQLAADVYLRNLKRMEKQLRLKQALLDDEISRKEYEEQLQEETLPVEQVVSDDDTSAE